MSLRSLFDRSRDALYAFAAGNPVVERVEDMGLGVGVGEQPFGPVVGGMAGLLGGNDLRNVLFWAAIVVVLLLLAALSNPNENSFRSHLTELSFRKHLVDIRTSDSLHSSSDHADTDLTSPHAHPVTVTSGSHSSNANAPTPFRFANHVAINLRTPPMLYRSHWFFSTGIATPLASPSILGLSDPMLVLKRGRDKEKERPTVYIGFFGHWSPVTINLVADLVVAILGDGREKGKRSQRPGILDVKALSAKDDAPSAKALPLAPKLLKPEPVNEPLVPPTPSPSLSRRPSLGQQISDVPDSPLVTSLKSDLAAAQLTLSELKSQLQLHESSTDSTLTASLDDLRNRRKEDDAERQELKSKTKSLEDQKRQAESARREAEKKLRAVENLRDGLESKIAAARSGAVETRGNMDQSEKNVRSVQEEGARHVVETIDTVEVKKEELGRLEVELADLEGKNDELGKAVKEAEDRLKVVTESGARASPEEEMMMMAAAYEAAAQEGYLHQSQNQWAHQAAAYMAEAGMPYLSQDYTARPTRTASANHHADLSGFEDFGPGPRDRDASNQQSTHTLHGLQHHQTQYLHQQSQHSSHLLPMPSRSLDMLNAARTPEAEEEEEEVEIGPGSPNGTSFLPQGLFRSIDSDAASINLDGHESGSDSGDELWRSPGQPEHALVPTMSETAKRLPAPNNTTPPGGAPSALPGLPALPGSRRWFSGTSSNENVAFSFMHPVGTTSNDSLNFDPSPFAPSASEKKALLKWGPLSKHRWARGNDTATAPPSGPSARSSSVDLGNGIVPTSVSGGSGSGNGSGSGSSTSNWLTSRFGSSTSSTSASDARAQAAFSAFANHQDQPNVNANANGNRNGNGNANFSPGREVSKIGVPLDVQAEDEDKQTEKKTFGFFSLRKTPSSTS